MSDNFLVNLTSKEKSNIMPIFRPITKLERSKDLFISALEKMSKTMNLQTVFDPNDPLTGYKFLRDHYSSKFPDVKTKIYGAIKTNLKEVAKDAGFSEEEIQTIPATNQIDRYSVEEYIKKGYIEGKVERQILSDGKVGKVIDSEVLLKHVLFLNLFLYKSGILGLPKRKPARKKGEDRVKVTSEEVFDFIRTFLSGMPEAQKQEFIKSLA